MSIAGGPAFASFKYVKVILSILIILSACSSDPSKEEKEEKQAKAAPEAQEAQEGHWVIDSNKKTCLHYPYSLEEMVSSLEQTNQSACEVKMHTSANIATLREIICGDTSWFVTEDEEFCQLLVQGETDSRTVWMMVPEENTCEHMNVNLDQFVYVLENETGDNCTAEQFVQDLPQATHVKCGVDKNWILGDDEQTCRLLLQNYNNMKGHSI